MADCYPTATFFFNTHNLTLIAEAHCYTVTNVTALVVTSQVLGLTVCPLTVCIELPFLTSQIPFVTPNNSINTLTFVI